MSEESTTSVDTPVEETVDPAEVTEAAKALIEALQRLTAAQFKSLPADVQAAIEKAVSEIKSGADTVTTQAKGFEERVSRAAKAAWDILCESKELPEASESPSEE
ncbi:hypothetical protein L3556_08615 [Candidatus Synechococcus calcipolaris G9]|uniref:Uncharacterized protein n=1 Tax=Candidatus Synechococcus calcipolaris G9 TaxID=1497997 RepID=A0ABT6EZH9_9SYNE|nr:hypothetical protein [Candidatus Synechococcus calcipolaris]MDG2990987.1 hypothetical protein [Candidatus Synechococcus calcipolaris G9]